MALTEDTEENEDVSDEENIITEGEYSVTNAGEYELTTGTLTQFSASYEFAGSEYTEEFLLTTKASGDSSMICSGEMIELGSGSVMMEISPESITVECMTVSLG